MKKSTLDISPNADITQALISEKLNIIKKELIDVENNLLNKNYQELKTISKGIVGAINELFEEGKLNVEYQEIVKKLFVDDQKETVVIIGKILNIELLVDIKISVSGTGKDDYDVYLDGENLSVKKVTDIKEIRTLQINISGFNFHDFNYEIVARDILRNITWINKEITVGTELESLYVDSTGGVNIENLTIENLSPEIASHRLDTNNAPRIHIYTTGISEGEAKFILESDKSYPQEEQLTIISQTPKVDIDLNTTEIVLREETDSNENLDFRIKNYRELVNLTITPERTDLVEIIVDVPNNKITYKPKKLPENDEISFSIVVNADNANTSKPYQANLKYKIVQWNIFDYGGGEIIDNITGSISAVLNIEEIRNFGVRVADNSVGKIELSIAGDNNNDIRCEPIRPGVWSYILTADNAPDLTKTIKVVDRFAPKIQTNPDVSKWKEQNPFVINWTGASNLKIFDISNISEIEEYINGVFWDVDNGAKFIPNEDLGRWNIFGMGASVRINEISFPNSTLVNIILDHPKLSKISFWIEFKMPEAQ